jgi:hypothetical protein
MRKKASEYVDRMVQSERERKKRGRDDLSAVHGCRSQSSAFVVRTMQNRVDTSE